MVYWIWFLDHVPLALSIYIYIHTYIHIYIYTQYTMYDYIILYMVYAPTYHLGALPMEYQQFRSLPCQVFWGSVSTPAEELKSSNWFIGKLFIKPAARSLRIMQVSIGILFPWPILGLYCMKKSDKSGVLPCFTIESPFCWWFDTIKLSAKP